MNMSLIRSLRDPGFARVVMPGMVTVVASLLLYSCRHVLPPAPPPHAPLSIEQRRQMQTHNYDAGYDVVFASTIAVFQDLGWILETVDKPSGMIRATTAKKPDVFGPEDELDYDPQHRRETSAERAAAYKKWQRWREAMVHTEPWGAGSRQRIVLTLRGSLPAMSYRDEMGGGLFRRGREVLINALPVEQTIEVTLPEAYSDFFERIQQAVNQRKALQP